MTLPASLTVYDTFRTACEIRITVLYTTTIGGWICNITSRIDLTIGADRGSTPAALDSASFTHLFLTKFAEEKGRWVFISVLTQSSRGIETYLIPLFRAICFYCIELRWFLTLMCLIHFLRG